MSDHHHALRPGLSCFGHSISHLSTSPRHKAQLSCLYPIMASLESGNPYVLPWSGEDLKVMVSTGRVLVMMEGVCIVFENKHKIPGQLHGRSPAKPELAGDLVSIRCQHTANPDRTILTAFEVVEVFFFQQMGWGNN